MFSKSDGFIEEEIVGDSLAIQDILHQVRIVAKTDSMTLIQGETGTGKEVIARAIHNQSLRSRGPFVKLNCAAIPGPLLESELFGHEALSRSVCINQGRFQLADKGTLFLDESGDLPLELQPKLLRVLQEQEFEATGQQPDDSGGRCALWPQPIRISLAELVAIKQFRADLYYRLNVIPIFLLSAAAIRAQDIPLLVEYFVRKLSARLNKPIDSIPEEVMEILEAHDWPVNADRCNCRM